MSDRIAEIEKRIALKKERILSTSEDQQRHSESIAATKLGLTAEEKVFLTVEILNLSKSNSQFDKDKASAIRYFLSTERANYTEIFQSNHLSKDEILHLSEIDAKKKQILRHEGISIDENQYHYLFPELFPEEYTEQEIKTAKLRRSITAEWLKKRDTNEYERTQDIVSNKIIHESKKPVKCFKTMSELYMLKSILTEDKKEFDREMAELISELYD